MFKLNKESERNVAAAFLAVHNVNFGIVGNVVHQSVKGFAFFLHGQHKFVVDVQFRRFSNVQIGRFQQQTVVRRIGFHRVVGVKLRLLGNYVVALGKFEGEILKFFVGNYNFRLENKFYFGVFQQRDNVSVGSNNFPTVKFVPHIFISLFCHSPRLNLRSPTNCACCKFRVGKSKDVHYIAVFAVVSYCQIVLLA